MRLFSSVLIWCALASAGNAHELTLAEIRSALSKRGASWTAGETKISRLSTKARSALFGALAGPADALFHPAPSISDVTALPAKWDWRDVGGVNYVSPVLDQGICGSCVAFATVGTLETQMNIRRRTPHSPWRYSPQHLFSCGGGSCQHGWRTASALVFLSETGIPDEACFPYASGTSGEDIACRATCGGAAARSQKIVNWYTPTYLFRSVERVKKALLKGPLISAMTVYEDFAFYAGGVYRHVTGKLSGSHAVSIVGWNDADKAWIVRNSWGPDWGESGYFRVHWNDASGLATNTFGIEVGEEDGSVSIVGLREREVLSGEVKFNLESTYPQTSGIEWILTSGDKIVARNTSPRSGQVTWDSRSVPDGVYELAVEATHGPGQVLSRSHVHEVSVLNHEFKGALRLVAVSNNKVVLGKIDFIIEAQSAPIPFTQLVFRAENLDTGAKFVRGTSNVETSMTLSWQTEHLPVGRYTAKVEGKVGDQVKVTSAPLGFSLKSQPSRRKWWFW